MTKVLANSQGKVCLLNGKAIESNGGGGDTITATNKTGADITAGDKVFINGSTGNYRLDRYYVKGEYYNKIYNGVTINESTGVASGFSATQYIEFTEPFSPLSYPWEAQFKFTTSGDVTTEQQIFQSCSGTGNAGRYGIGFSIIPSSKFAFFCSADNASWLFDLSGTYTVLANTTYYVKFGWTGTEYYLEYSLDGTNYTRDITYTSSTPVYSWLIYTYIGVYSTGSFEIPFFGTIDLSQTKITLNNVDWWVPDYSYSFSKALYPLFYRTTAIATLTNGFIGTGFSSNKDWRFYSFLEDFDASNFTLCMKIKTGTISSGDQNFLSGNLDLRVGGGHFRAWNGNNAVSLLECSANTTYYIKLYCNGTQRILYKSTDGVNWAHEEYAMSSALSGNSIYLVFGNNPYVSGYQFAGQIMFEEVYLLNANNVEVWRAVEKVRNPLITNTTLMGYATQSIANGSSGSVSILRNN